MELVRGIPITRFCDEQRPSTLERPSTEFRLGYVNLVELEPDGN